nr:uncharacterized protein LOC116147508 [Camelus dromedarius]
MGLKLSFQYPGGSCKLRLRGQRGCVKCGTQTQLQGLLLFLFKPKVCIEPRTGRSGGQGGAQPRGERSATSFARLREPAASARELEPEEARGRGQSPGRARPRPPQRGLRSLLLPSPGGAGREHKRLPTSERARGPPRQLLAQARPAGRKRAGNAGGGQERARAGQAGDPGRRDPRGGRSGGRGPGVTRAPGTPRMAERRVSKNRQRPAPRGGRSKRNKKYPPAPLRRRPRPPLTRAERSGGSRAARKEAVPPHTGAEGRERGRDGGRRRPWPRREELSTRAVVFPTAATAPSASLRSANPAPAPLARPAALTAARAPQPRVLPSAGTTGSGGWGRPERLPSARPRPPLWP